VTLGDGLAEAVCEVVASPAGTVRAAGLADGELAFGGVARARTPWEPAKVSMLTPTAATTQITTTVAAIARPGFARMLRHLINVTTSATRVRHTDSARRVACCRYATTSGVAEKQSFSTCSRSPGGSGSSGCRPERAAGRSVSRRRAAQVSH